MYGGTGNDVLLAIADQILWLAEVGTTYSIILAFVMDQTIDVSSGVHVSIAFNSEIGGSAIGVTNNWGGYDGAVQFEEITLTAHNDIVKFSARISILATVMFTPPVGSVIISQSVCPGGKKRRTTPSSGPVPLR